ncbi:O-antigen ligase family protein [Rhodococcus sp. IEGM 1318]|uniref:O-antigen ligase family protein n=1 Tax=Rhodococcus sp. IEGM 1318 TaxID=3082226 RepID=UPI002954709C|nr:O-antigen ligase family protein [Rhodococcus sp. IEGM 1318]MDV8006331.1 O-antigen ligase family protein [Rhodococcus sp. IEGM 1318]
MRLANDERTVDVNIATLLIGAVLGAVVCAAIYQRPQRGVLLVALFAPLHGLLAIIPNGTALAGWKEGLILLTLICAFLSPNRHGVIRPSMPWWPAAVVWVAMGCVSAFTLSGLGSLGSIKITYFYMLLPLILWRAPFTREDRDHLVSILMGVGILAAVVGLLQQVVGPEFLVSLGYSYTEEIRITGGILRSFSTFTGPFAFGLYVMLSLVVGLSVSLNEPTRLRNMIFLAATPIMIAGMGVSIVRASYIGFAAGLLWLAIYKYKSLLVLFAAAAAAIPIALLLTPTSVMKALFSSNSLEERGNGWSETVSSLWVNPLGQGVGATGSAAAKAAELAHPMINTLTIKAATTLRLIPYQPDNYYMKVAVELGPIGLWVFTLILVSAAVTGLRASRILPGQDGALSLGVSASIIAACVASLVSTYFEIFPLDLYFWLLIGTAGCALSQHHSEKTATLGPESPTEPWPSDPAVVGSRPTPVSSSPS